MKTVFKKNKNKKVYDFFSDSGHGWLKVNRTELQRLFIIEKVSGFSYEKKEFVYLEEDDDLSLFFKAKKEIDKITIKFRTHYSDKSDIRNYYGFNFNRVDRALKEILESTLKTLKRG